MRLALRVVWRSVSQSRHRVPLVVGSPQAMQGRGMGMVHLRSRCLCIRSSGIANDALSDRRGGCIGDRCGVVGSCLERMLRVELRLRSRLGRGLPSSPHPRVGMVALAFLVCVASVYQVGKRSDAYPAFRSLLLA